MTTAVDTLERWSRDPLAFIDEAFPWGQTGTELESFPGPRVWQRDTAALIRDLLAAGVELQEAVQIAVASGHGIGKSAFVAMIILWSISTRIDTRGVVTANTENQLTTKTWPELAKWHRLSVCREEFIFTATALYSADKEHEKNWRIDATPWSETNTEAFAGLHNKGRRLLLIFDEASAIADKVWEVAEGALTDSDTEIIWLAFGNATRNTGRFRECFGKFKHRWQGRQIDSRTVEGTNVAQFAKWVEDYGEDSDFVRTRVRGQFPRAGALQFISSEVVEAAKTRRLSHKDPGAPFILGVDIARFGDDKSVIRGRQGRDGRPFRPIKWRGMDTNFSAGKVMEAIELYQPDAVFIDGGGVGAGVIDILRSRSYKVIEVNFGSKAGKELIYANKRAEMWGECRDWLETGSIDEDQELTDDLVGPEYGFDKDGRYLLEKKPDMKSRGLASPDDGDAFALTFAHPVHRKDLATSRMTGVHRPQFAKRSGSVLR
jgi:hypothetical protein